MYRAGAPGPSRAVRAEQNVVNKGRIRAAEEAKMKARTSARGASCLKDNVLGSSSTNREYLIPAGATFARTVPADCAS